MRRVAFVLGVGLFAASFVLGGVEAWRRWHRVPTIGIRPLALGLKAAREQNFAEAAAEFRAAATVDWTDTFSLRQLAAARYADGDKAGALEALQEAAAVERRDPGVFVLLSRLLTELDRPDEARTALARAAELEVRGAPVADTPASATLPPTACPDGASRAFDCARGPRTSPFTCMRFTAECRVEVQFEAEGEWFGLLGVNGVGVDGIADAARSRCGPEQWKKRIAEDLNGPMEGVCAPLSVATRVRVQSLAAGAAPEDRVAPSSAENRNRVKDCYKSLDACPQ